MMRFRFNISRKIALGFSIIILLTIIFSYILLDKSTSIVSRFSEEIDPSLSAVNKLKLLITESKMYTINWVYVPKGTEDKRELRRIQNERYPKLKKEIMQMRYSWKPEDIARMDKVFEYYDELEVLQKEIMYELETLEDYNDGMKFFYAGELVEKVVDISSVMHKELTEINESLNDNARLLKLGMKRSFENLQYLIKGIAVFIIILGIIITLLTVRAIVGPINSVRNVILRMGKGELPEAIPRVSNDEVGDMTKAVNHLIQSRANTADFASKIGAGDFNAWFEKLSEKDVLGEALINMRDDLKKATERTRQLLRIVEAKNKDITDSINYARQIQQAILPNVSVFNSAFPDSFVFYKPKDVVSGDFPWFVRKENDVYRSAVDCTGHGVPGALMSLIAFFLLNENVKQKNGVAPAEVLDFLHTGINVALRQQDVGSQSKDGADIALCRINTDTMELQYAGAQRPLIHIREGKLCEIRGDKFPVGGNQYDHRTNFTNHSIPLQKGDCIYVFSDGLGDQFGGPNEKKFGTKRIKEALLNLVNFDMKEQHQRMEQVFMEWKRDFEQIDDVLMIGVKV